METGPCLNQQQQGYVAATCRYVANLFSLLNSEGSTLQRSATDSVAMAHGTVGTLSHHPGDASDRWIVLRSIDWLCRQGGGKGFLKLQIAFGVGGLMGWWARGRVEGSGEGNWVWTSCPHPHGKSQWDSCQFFSKYPCPRPIAE